MKISVKEIKESLAGSIMGTVDVLTHRALEADDNELFIAASEVRRTGRKLRDESKLVVSIANKAADKVGIQQKWKDGDESGFGPFYCGVNSLGELQAVGPAFVIACALSAKAVV